MLADKQARAKRTIGLTARAKPFIMGWQGVASIENETSPARRGQPLGRRQNMDRAQKKVSLIQRLIGLALLALAGGGACLPQTYVEEDTREKEKVVPYQIIVTAVASLPPEHKKEEPPSSSVEPERSRGKSSLKTETTRKRPPPPSSSAPKSHPAGGAGFVDLSLAKHPEPLMEYEDLKTYLEKHKSPEGKLRVSLAGRDGSLTGRWKIRLSHLIAIVKSGVTALDLTDTNINDERLFYLSVESKSLEELTLVDTRVTNKGLQWLKELKSLRVLMLGGEHFTEKKVQEILNSKPWPHLTSLILNSKLLFPAKKEREKTD